MKSKFPLLILTALMLAACGKSSEDSSNQAEANPNKNQTCVSHFLNSTQVNEITQTMKPSLHETIELQASLLTTSIASAIGTEKTLSLLQAGLLTDWLAQMRQNQMTLNSTDICKTKSGESL
jgi:hypothetical protein